MSRRVGPWAVPVAAILALGLVLASVVPVLAAGGSAGTSAKATQTQNLPGGSSSKEHPAQKAQASTSQSTGSKAGHTAAKKPAGHTAPKGSPKAHRINKHTAKPVPPRHRKGRAGK